MVKSIAFTISCDYCSLELESVVMNVIKPVVKNEMDRFLLGLNWKIIKREDRDLHICPKCK